MTSISEAVDQGPTGTGYQLVERYASVLLGRTRQAGPATPQDDLADLLPSEDAIGVTADAGDGAVVIVMMTPAFVVEIAGGADPAAAAAAIQPVFDRVAAESGRVPTPVRPIVGAAQLSECVGDRPVVLSAGIFNGETIDATVSIATFAEAPMPTTDPAPDGAVNVAPTAQASVTMPALGDPIGAPQRGTESSGIDSSVLRRGLQLLADVHLDLTAQLGRAEMTVSQVLELTPGAVIELDRLAGAPLDLYVNGSLFARADVIVVDDTYAVQITEIIGDGNPG